MCSEAVLFNSQKEKAMLGNLLGKRDGSSSSSSNSSGPRRVPRPIAQIPELRMSLERMRAYEAAIEGVLDRPELELFSAQITAYFVERNIPLFDYQETHDYLTDRQILGKNDNPWHWAHVHSAGKDLVWGDPYLTAQPGYHSPHVQKYYELIPVRVLRRIRDLQEAFAGRLMFYISKNGQSDRYIMALVDSFLPHKDTVFIFDVWDDNAPEEGDPIPSEDGYSISS